MREVWKSVLAFLKNTIPEEVFVPWFGKVEFTEDSEPDIINISVPSVPHSKFIKAQYEKDIEEKASEICGREIKLKITVKDPNKGAMISEPLPRSAERSSRTIRTPIFCASQRTALLMRSFLCLLAAATLTRRFKSLTINTEISMLF